MDVRVGDILVMKKNHPCGENKFLVLRSGMDFKLRCKMCIRDRYHVDWNAECVHRHPYCADDPFSGADPPFRFQLPVEKPCPDCSGKIRIKAVGICRQLFVLVQTERRRYGGKTAQPILGTQRTMYRLSLIHICKEGFNMNLPNKLTMLRILMIPVFMVLDVYKRQVPVLQQLQKRCLHPRCCRYK